MCSRKLLLVWALLLPCLPLFGEVTEQERQKAEEALTNIEGFTKVLQANSEQRELYFQATEKSQNEREQLLSEREKSLDERDLLQNERERLQTEKESSLQSRESSLQVTMTLTEESKKLYEQAEKRLKATSFWLKVGILGAGVGGFLLGGLGR